MKIGGEHVQLNQSDVSGTYTALPATVIQDLEDVEDTTVTEDSYDQYLIQANTTNASKKKAFIQSMLHDPSTDKAVSVEEKNADIDESQEFQVKAEEKEQNMRRQVGSVSKDREEEIQSKQLDAKKLLHEQIKSRRRNQETKSQNVTVNKILTSSGNRENHCNRDNLECHQRLPNGDAIVKTPEPSPTVNGRCHEDCPYEESTEKGTEVFVDVPIEEQKVKGEVTTRRVPHPKYLAGIFIKVRKNPRIRQQG